MNGSASQTANRTEGRRLSLSDEKRRDFDMLVPLLMARRTRTSLAAKFSICTLPKTMKAVVFDMDGLMIDSERVYFDVGRQLAREFGKEVSDQTLGRMMGRKPLESMIVYRTELGLTQAPEDLLKMRESRVMKAFEAGVAPMPGLTAVLPKLAEKYKLAIATSARRSMVDVIMRPLNLLQYFAVVQTSDDVIHGKPNPEIYLKAMARLDVKPSESIVLEDSSNGARAGKNAGAYTIAVPSIYTRDQDFTFVDYVASSLTDAATKIASLA